MGIQIRKMKFLFIFIQIIAAWTVARDCIALTLRCSGGFSSFEQNHSCENPVPRMITFHSVWQQRNAGIRFIDGGVDNTACRTAFGTEEASCEMTAIHRDDRGLRWTTTFKSELLGLTETLTCRQSPSDGQFAPWTERQTREYAWNDYGELELVNGY